MFQLPGGHHAARNGTGMAFTPFWTIKPYQNISNCGCLVFDIHVRSIVDLLSFFVCFFGCFMIYFCQVCGGRFLSGGMVCDDQYEDRCPDAGVLRQLDAGHRIHKAPFEWQHSRTSRVRMSWFLGNTFYRLAAPGALSSNMLHIASWLNSNRNLWELANFNINDVSPLVWIFS